MVLPAIPISCADSWFSPSGFFFFSVSNTLPYFIKWEEIATDNSKERMGNAEHCCDFNLLPLRTLSSRLEKSCWFSCDRDQTRQDSGKKIPNDKCKGIRTILLSFI